MNERVRRWLHQPWCWALLAWTSVYLVVAALGHVFVDDFLEVAWQLAPLDALRAEPIASTWYLHIQPPLWNLGIGSVLRWSPLPDALSLQLLWFALAAATVALLADALHRLSGWRVGAAAIAVVVMCNPQVLTLAYQPAYELPTTLGLVIVLWLVARRPRSIPATFIACSVALTTVAMTRAMYHPLWLALVLLVLWWAWRPALDRRTIALAVMVPLLVTGGWMLKNQVLFDHFTLSSWTGMNLQRSVVQVLSPEEIDRLVAEGVISPISQEAPYGFVGYERYAPLMPPCSPTRSHPVLTIVERPGEFAQPNFNYECFLPVFDQASADARAVIREVPSAYVTGRVWATKAWFMTFDTAYETQKSPGMNALDRLYRVIDVRVPVTLSNAPLQSSFYAAASRDTDLAVAKIAFLVLVLVVGCRSGWRVLRRRGEPVDVALLIGAAIAGWTFASGVLFELGEQPRFRATTDPIVDALGIWLVVVMVGRLLARRRTSPALEPAAPLVGD